MKKKMKKYSEFSNWGWFFFYLALLFIIFSFVAPLILTDSDYWYCYTDKEIEGDSVGSLMNPFIAIAGVIATFLAFFMQLRANEMQRKQFLKSLKEPFIKDKLLYYNYLSLSCVDIKFIKFDINRRIDFCDVYKKAVLTNPFYLGQVKRPAINTLEKRLDYDRKIVFKSLHSFDPINCDEHYNSYLRLFDYIEFSIIEVYRVFDEDNKFKLEQMNTIRQLLNDMEIEGVDLANNYINNNIGENINNVNKLLFRYNDEARNTQKDQRNTNYVLIEKILNEFYNSITDNQKINKLYRKFIINVREILLIMNDIRGKNTIFLDSYDGFKNEMISNEDSTLTKLSDLSKNIDKIIKSTSEKKIIDDFMND